MSIVTPGFVLRRRIDRYSAHVRIPADAEDLIKFVRATKAGLRLWMMRKSGSVDCIEERRPNVFVGSSDCIYTGSGAQKPYIEDRTGESPRSDDVASSDGGEPNQPRDGEF